MLLLALLLVIVTAGTAAPARAASEGYVATDLLNLRSQAGVWGDVIREMAQGESITVLEGPTDDGWYLVDYAGTTGWAYGGYLSIDGQTGWAAAAEAEVGATGGSAWVGTDGLNVRDAADQDAGVLDTLSQGSELAVAGGPENGFYPIAYGGGIGWVWSEYVSWEAVGAGPEQWLDVDRSSGTVRMMVGDESIATYSASMGMDSSDDGFYATALGSYRVYDRFAGLTWTPYGQAYIKYWVGFDASRLNGFHSYSLNENGKRIKGGDGPTGGCIATEPQSSKEIHAFAFVGMRVEVHW